MVFTKLSAQEKDAFFGLLDEYFQSRPELFERDQGVSGGGLGGTGISTAAASSLVQRALAANATSSTSGGPPGKSNNPYAAALHATSNNADAAQLGEVTIGRVAAASRAFAQASSGGGSGGGSSASAAPSFPRRPGAAVTLPSTTAVPGAQVDKLVSHKASVMSAFRKQPSAGVAIPPAFAAPKNSFGPPPVRRGGGDGTRATLPQTSEPAEEVAEGEWVEVLYEYSSEDSGDLTIEAGMRVWVTAKSSEDWWTGQIEGQGKEGLFPASYVKPL